MATNYDFKYDDQIQIQQPLPGNTPSQVLAVGPYGMIDLSYSTPASLTNQVGPALMLSTTYPHVVGALYLSAYNTTTGVVTITASLGT